MNIVQVPRRFVTEEWGGTETVILETSKHLIGQGHSSEILCPNALSQCAKETVKGVKVSRFPYFYPYWGLGRSEKHQLDKKGGNLFSFSLLKALWKHPRLDVIHLHTGKRAGGIGRYIARKRKIPYVITLHGGVLDVPQEEALSWTQPTEKSIEWGKLLGWWVGSRRVLDDAAAIICVGQQECSRIRERYANSKNKVIYLPNGVDAQRFTRGDGPAFRHRYGISQQARVLLMVGRIDPQKNQSLLIKALYQLRKRDPDLHLILLGPVTNEAYRRTLVDSIAQLGLESAVTLVAGLDAASQELVDAYHAADIFTITSIHEPFGIVVLEAWASGLPVVASRVGGLQSLVEDNQDGLLFQSDDLADLVSKLETMLGDETKRLSLADKGREKSCKHYSWDKITAQLTQIYEDVLSANSASQRKTRLFWRR